MFLLLICALVVVCYCAGAITERLRTRPPEIPSTGYFAEADREPADEAEMRRRTVREAMLDWREAFDWRERDARMEAEIQEAGARVMDFTRRWPGTDG